MSDQVGPAKGTGNRRGYAAALLVGLLSAAAVTAGVTRPWYAASATVRFLPELDAAATGADLAPLAGALGVVLLASFGAVMATRGWLRRWLGVLIVAGAVVVLVAVADPSGVDRVLRAELSAVGWSGGGYITSVTPWRWLSLLGAVGCIAAGAAVAWFGAQWPTMGQRYDAPDAARDGAADADKSGAEPDGNVSTEELWRAVDRGRDPTQRG